MWINGTDCPGIQLSISFGLFYDLDWFYNELKQNPKFVPEGYRVYVNSKKYMAHVKRWYRICA